MRSGRVFSPRGGGGGGGGAANGVWSAPLSIHGCVPVRGVGQVDRW